MDKAGRIRLGQAVLGLFSEAGSGLFCVFVVLFCLVLALVATACFLFVWFGS